MRLPNPFRRGRHRSDQRKHLRNDAPRITDCCTHCRHDPNDPPHESGCPRGCHGAPTEAVTLSWLAEIGAVTYWPQHEPEHDGWLAGQLAAWRPWADSGWAYLDRWHAQAAAAAASIDRILYPPDGITRAATI